MPTSYRLARWVSCVLLWSVAMPSFACGECEYEACVLGACACLPKSGCILRNIPAPIRPPDPGKWTEKAKADPIGAVVNPFGVYNPTGIPQIGDVVEFAIKNPDQIIGVVQNPGRILYTPVATAIISGRNAVIAAGASPIPGNIKMFLRRWHTQELIDSVRWTANWSAVSNTLQAAQMSFNPQTRAIALINTVVFRDTQAANEPALWAHEMVHIQQYRDWGVTEFARKWVDNSANGGPVESPAYARGSEAERILTASSLSLQPMPQIVGVVPQGMPSGWMLGPCGCWGFIDANAVGQAPVCASGLQVPRMCGPVGTCYGGGAPWVNTCR